MKILISVIIAIFMLSGCETYKAFSDVLDKSVDENRREMTAQAITRYHRIGVGNVTADQVKIRNSYLENGFYKWIAEIPKDDLNVRPWLWDCSVPNSQTAFDANHTSCIQSACYPYCE